MPATLKRKKQPLMQQRQKPKGKKAQPVKNKGSLKPRVQARSRSLVVKHGKNPSRNPSMNDVKILRQLERSNKYMTSKAKGIMSSLVRTLCRKVSVEAERLRRQKKRTSVGVTEMRSALKSVMVPVMCKMSVEGTPKSGGHGSVMAP